jgi:hypothetical protein
VEELKRLVDVMRRKQGEFVERVLIDSTWQHTSTFFALSVSVFSSKRHLCHGSSVILSCLGSSWLLAVSGTQECAFSEVEDFKTPVKKILMDIPVQDFKNCFEQWLKRLKHCKELEGDYFEKF